MSDEKLVQCAAKLYEMRALARAILGERYAEEIDTVKTIIKGYATERKLTLMKASLELMADAEKGEHMRLMAYIGAATVDLSEEGIE